MMERLVQNGSSEDRISSAGMFYRNFLSHVTISHKFLVKRQLCELQHPPYSPDLPPCGYFMFLKPKMDKKGTFYHSVTQIQETVTMLIEGYLSNVLDTILEDEVNVIGYTTWSLLDNFEWTQGYTQKFGLVQVDFNSPNRTRTLKSSAEWYSRVVAARQIVD